MSLRINNFGLFQLNKIYSIGVAKSLFQFFSTINMIFLSAVSKQLNPPTITCARMVLFATHSTYNYSAGGRCKIRVENSSEYLICRVKQRERSVCISFKAWRAFYYTSMLWRCSQNIVFHYNTNAITSIKNLWRQSWSVYDVIREYQIRGFSHLGKHLHWRNKKSFDYGILIVTQGMLQRFYDIQFKGDRRLILQLLEISMYLLNCRMPKMLLGNSTL